MLSKHSVCLVANSDLPSFTDRDGQLIAALCRFYRKSQPQLKHSCFDELSAGSKRLVTYFMPLLRLADSLDRSHESEVNNARPVLRDNGIDLEIEAEAGVEPGLWACR